MFYSARPTGRRLSQWPPTLGSRRSAGFQLVQVRWKGAPCPHRYQLIPDGATTRVVTLFCFAGWSKLWAPRIPECCPPGCTSAARSSAGASIHSMSAFLTMSCSLCHPTCCACSPTRPTSADAHDTSVGALEPRCACNHLPSSQRRLYARHDID
jgi:hypothetical protein